MENGNERLLSIILKYRNALQNKIKNRQEEMQTDNTDHYLIYNALGFTNEQGYQIEFNKM